MIDKTICALFAEKVNDDIIRYARQCGTMDMFGVQHTFTYTEDDERKHYIFIDNLALVSYYSFLTEDYVQRLIDLIIEENLITLIFDDVIKDLKPFHQDYRVNHWMILDFLDSAIKQLEEKEETTISIIHQKSFKSVREMMIPID